MYTGTFKPANSTTARKPGNDMKKNASIAKMGDSPAAWQKADKALGFNGQDNGSSQRNPAQKGTANMSKGFSDPNNIQLSQMPNKRGNVTGKTANGGTATAAVLGHTGMPVKGFGNPDMIQVRQLANRTGNKCD